MSDKQNSISNLARDSSLVGKAFEAKHSNLKVRSAAFVLVIDQRNNCLLTVNSVNRPELMHLPGGKVDSGETPQQAANRELLEELGLDLRMFELETRVTHYGEELWRETFFVAFVSEPQYPQLSAEVQAYGWIDLNTFIPAAREWLEWGPMVYPQQFITAPVTIQEHDWNSCMHAVWSLGDDQPFVKYCPKHGRPCTSDVREQCRDRTPFITKKEDEWFVGHNVLKPDVTLPVTLGNTKLMEEAWRRLWLDIPVSIEVGEDYQSLRRNKVFPPVVSKVLAYALGLEDCF